MPIVDDVIERFLATFAELELHILRGEELVDIRNLDS